MPVFGVCVCFSYSQAIGSNQETISHHGQVRGVHFSSGHYIIWMFLFLASCYWSGALSFFQLAITCYYICQEKQPFDRIEVTREQALEMFSDNSFKVSKLLGLTRCNLLHHNKTVPIYSRDFNFHFLLCGTFLIRSFFDCYNQVEIINDLPADKTITVYRCGPLVDLCRGPHIPNTSFVKAFKCLKVMFT